MLISPAMPTPPAIYPEAWTLVLIDREHSVRAINVHLRARRELTDPGGEVAQRLDRQLDGVALGA